MVNSDQLTVLWHVDDMLISHSDPDVVSNIIDFLKVSYESSTLGSSNGKMKVTQGDSHVYLGMNIRFAGNHVKVSMEKYVKDMVSDFSSENKVKNCPTPEGIVLFIEKDNCKILSDEIKMKFYNMVAKALYVSKWARPDISTAVEFLCTRVKAPTVHDWDKLKRLIKYLPGMIEMSLNLSTNGIPILKWYVDFSFAVHNDCRSHTGGVLFFWKRCCSFGV